MIVGYGVVFYGLGQPNGFVFMLIGMTVTFGGLFGDKALQKLRAAVHPHLIVILYPFQDDRPPMIDLFYRKLPESMVMYKGKKFKWRNSKGEMEEVQAFTTLLTLIWPTYTFGSHYGLVSKVIVEHFRPWEERIHLDSADAILGGQSFAHGQTDIIVADELISDPGQGVHGPYPVIRLQHAGGDFIRRNEIPMEGVDLIE